MEELETEHLPLWQVCERNLEGGEFFNGDPEGYVKEGSGNRHLSPYGPQWGTWREACLPQCSVLLGTIERLLVGATDRSTSTQRLQSLSISSSMQ